MKKTSRTFLTLFLLVMGTVMSWADFKNFSAVLNNQDGVSNSLRFHFNMGASFGPR